MVYLCFVRQTGCLEVKEHEDHFKFSEHGHIVDNTVNCVGMDSGESNTMTMTIDDNI